MGPLESHADTSNDLMKHLKSTLGDLRHLFDRSVTVRYLAEPLASFDGPRDAADVRRFMEQRDFDVVGVRINGEVVGYAEAQQLHHGSLDHRLHEFHDHDLLDESTGIVVGLQRLTERPRVYVRSLGQVLGIITKGDLQKAPLRMWLFGLVSLLEMHLLRLIRGTHPDDSWTALLSASRVEKARAMLEDRRRRNEAIDLADCLQFADKRCIVAKTESIRSAIGFGSKNEAKKVLKDLEQLRDDLAHAQDIVTGRWPELAQLALTAESVLERCEAVG